MKITLVCFITAAVFVYASAADGDTTPAAPTTPTVPTPAPGATTPAATPPSPADDAAPEAPPTTDKTTNPLQLGLEAMQEFGKIFFGPFTG